MTNTMQELFGDPVSIYTRADALEDGFLVDLNQWIPICESGYKYPVACTRAVWAIIEKAVRNKKHCNDYKGVIWDILWMSRARSRRSGERAVVFQVIINGAGLRKIYTFKIECGPGDNHEPVLTIKKMDE